MSRGTSSLTVLSTSAGGSKTNVCGRAASGIRKDCSRASHTTEIRSRLPRARPNSSSTGTANSAVLSDSLCVCFTSTTGGLGVTIPAIGHREFGVARAIDPLVEETREVAAAGALDRAREIDGLHAALRVGADVLVDRAPPERVAELRPQHVQHATALLIEVAVEEIDRLVIDVGDDGTAVAIGIFL